MSSILSQEDYVTFIKLIPDLIFSTTSMKDYQELIGMMMVNIHLTIHFIFIMNGIQIGEEKL